MSKAPQIELAVNKIAKATIKKVSQYPQPRLERIEVGFVQVPAGFCAILLSCATNDFELPVLETRADLKADSYKLGWDCGGCALVPELVYYRTEPPGIPYGLILVPVSPLVEEKYIL